MGRMNYVLLLTAGLLLLAGCAGASYAHLQAPAYTCHGQGPAISTPRQGASVAVGRLELKQVPPETPPGLGAADDDDEDDASSKKKPLRIKTVASLPKERLRVIAEAVPLGTLGAALALELGIGVVVAPSLVDLRVSLALPDTRVQGLLRRLRRHYGVEYTFREGVISLKDETEERLRSQASEMLFFHTYRLQGVSLEQVAAAWCAHGATSRGTASVVWDMLLVTDTWGGVISMDSVINALQAHHPPAVKERDSKDEPDPGSAGDGEEPGGAEEPKERVAPVRGQAGRDWVL
jgi:hypothetical protein